MADPTGRAVETPEDFGPTKADGVTRWLTEIKLAEAEQKDWVERANKCIKRYLDERTGIIKTDSGLNAIGSKQFNILWSNVQTLLPALFARAPKPEVSRRYDDPDPVGKVASIVLERDLEFGLEDDRIERIARLAVLDYLLTGRGQLWARYEPKFETATAPATQEPEDIAEGEAPEAGEMAPAPGGLTAQTIGALPADQPGAEADEEARELQEDSSVTAGEQYDRVAWERAPLDRVHWKDFLHSPARGWQEVRWVARRAYLSRDELVKRFGKLGEEVSLDWQPKLLEQDKSDTIKHDLFKKGIVWEIWDRDSRKAIWVSPGYKADLLDQRDDPLGLKDFFPCPEPLIATHGPDSIIPVPDYYEYQDQATMLDELVNRASLLIDALRVAGVYDASQEAIRRLLTEGGGNVLIPVDNWTLFGNQGGIKGTVDWLPLEMVAGCLNQIYIAIEKTKQQLYEITGIADIVRGASKADETATAQQIKSRFATLRLSDRQTDIARFLRDAIRIKAEIICEHFQPETMAMQSGIALTGDPTDMQMFSQAVALLRNDALREFRVDIETDSTIAADDDEEKKRRTEFLAMVGAFFQQALPVAQMEPNIVPLMGKMLQFGARGFKAGRELETAIDQYVASLEKQTQEAQSQPPQPPPPDPKAQAALITAQANAQAKQADTQIKAGHLQVAQEKAQAETAHKTQQQQLDAMSIAEQLKQNQQEMMLGMQQGMAKIQADFEARMAELRGEMAVKREGHAIDAAMQSHKVTTQAEVAANAAAVTPKAPPA